MMTRQPHTTSTNPARLAALAAAALLMSFSAAAQTFTQQVQQHRSGEGTVTIHHDADIDRLVNAAPSSAATAPAANKATHAPKATAAPAATTAKATGTAKAAPKAAKPKAEKPKAEKTKAEKPKKPQDDTTRTKPLTDTLPATNTPTTAESDTTVTTPAPRHAYKTTGYRVQAFAGGNTRHDRQKAERTGNAIRQLYPHEDVYVRFYSPRWVCRVGNYRTYEEAHDMMMSIRKMGYESATIVKGKIIVYTNP